MRKVDFDQERESDGSGATPLASLDMDFSDLLDDEPAPSAQTAAASPSSTPRPACKTEQPGSLSIPVPLINLDDGEGDLDVASSDHATRMSALPDDLLALARGDEVTAQHKTPAEPRSGVTSCVAPRHEPIDELAGLLDADDAVVTLDADDAVVTLDADDDGVVTLVAEEDDEMSALAREILEEDPLMPDVSRIAARVQDVGVAAAPPAPAPEMRGTFGDGIDLAALGAISNEAVPRVVKTTREMTKLPIDHRMGFLITNINGIHTVEEILDICAMQESEALELLDRLRELGVIEI